MSTEQPNAAPAPAPAPAPSTFKRFLNSLDNSVTKILREVGAHVSSQCPACKATVSAPIGAQVECVGCGEKFTVHSAAGVMAETGAAVGAAAEVAIKEGGKLAKEGAGKVKDMVSNRKTDAVPKPTELPGNSTIARSPMAE